MLATDVPGAVAVCAGPDELASPTGTLTTMVAASLASDPRCSTLPCVCRSTTAPCSRCATHGGVATITLEGIAVLTATCSMASAAVGKVSVVDTTAAACSSLIAGRLSNGICCCSCGGGSSRCHGARSAGEDEACAKKGAPKGPRTSARKLRSGSGAEEVCMKSVYST